MTAHVFNVYDTLAKLDALLESGHDKPSPMDLAEYKVLANTLVEGAAELLGHLAQHDVLTLETAESYEPIVARQISTAASDDDGGFSDEIVTIGLPAHLVPYGAVIDAMKAWNVGTIETVADLSVLARLWSRYLEAETNSEEESAILAEWQQQAERVSRQCLPAVQQLDAAGLLRIKDLRAGKTYPPQMARLAGSSIELSISTALEPSSRRAPKKSSAGKKPVRRRAD
jgi:hypothetical protein